MGARKTKLLTLMKQWVLSKQSDAVKIFYGAKIHIELTGQWNTPGRKIEIRSVLIPTEFKLVKEKEFSERCKKLISSSMSGFDKDKFLNSINKSVSIYENGTQTKKSLKNLNEDNYFFKTIDDAYLYIFTSIYPLKQSLEELEKQTNFNELYNEIMEKYPEIFLKLQ